MAAANICLHLLFMVFYPPVLGGLLSAHLFAKEAGMELGSEWPCDGPLLRLAEKIAIKLLPGIGW